jgi:hypothetical protein
MRFGQVELPFSAFIFAYIRLRGTQSGGHLSLLEARKLPLLPKEMAH